MNNIEMFTWNLFTIDRDTFVDVCMHSFSYFIPIYNAICDNVSEFVAKLCIELIFSMFCVHMLVLHWHSFCERTLLGILLVSVLD